MDHFGLDDHQPCSTRQSKHADKYVCYVCGAVVHPRQWSTAVFAHYIDSCACRGCHRYVCDALHTKRQAETVRIVREGLQSHRYHITVRYCALCSPLRMFGGLRGLGLWVAVVALVAAGALLALH